MTLGSDNSVFPSALEASVYELLLKREKTGEIKNIQKQQTVVLQEGARDVRITWRVDFSAEDVKTGKTVYFEAKGFATEVYKLKLKIFKKNPKGYLEIWGGSYKNPKLLEIVDEKLI